MRLAWKEIRYNWKKYFFIEILLVLMIFMVMFLSGLANGLARAVSAGIENMDASYFAVSSDAEDLITVSNLSTDTLEQVKSAARGKTAVLDIQRMNLNKEGKSEKLDVTYFAVNPDEFLNPGVIKGGKLTSKAHTIVLDDAFEENGIKAGDVLVDSASGVELTVTGFTKDAMYGHTPVGFISTKTYTDIRTAINPGFKAGYHAIALKSDNLSGKRIDKTDIVSKAEIIAHIPGYQAEQTTINMILWVLVFISAAILGVFFYILTIQKYKQFGVMKAIGMKMGEITRMQFSQVLLLACFGMLCGNILAFGMAGILPKSMPFYLNQMNAFIISLAFVAISLLCSLLSAGKIAKVDPVTIIGGSEE
ncbi:ABC transporter permease [Anaerocolumna xylanovorans]|uniref:Putative hemin transport system permease protein HrtB n=1 Tax=Anaerocolumna xylanovorans DSM 12503 TaxID=1121345 RepID=A0A1M7XWK5_9FIRM|nr:ABC transporter permease [Anaerocolumna xylanovorans]SHO42977.1 putative ABC transport system permease protein [Anaerocolumna xylanovorans DSM 12503]